MIPVLFKTSIKASPHPLSLPPSPPPSLPWPHIPTHSNMCAAVTCEEFQTPLDPPLTPTLWSQPPVPGPAPHILIIFISTIWVRDPWVAIQINFWGSLLSRTEVLHTCKILNYFYLPIYFWQGGGQLSGNGLQKMN